MKHEERAAAVAAQVNTIQAEHEALRTRQVQELQQAIVVKDRAIASILAADQRERDELDAAIATEAREKLWPLVKDFTEGGETRALTKKIVDTWCALSTRCRDELGAEMSYRLLGLAFADVIGHGDRLAHYSAWMFSAVGCNHAHKTNAAVQAIMRRDPISVIEAKLREAEVAVAEDASQPIYVYPDRYAAMISRATPAGIERALDAAENDRQKREHEEVVRTGSLGRYRLVGNTNHR